MSNVPLIKLNTGATIPGIGLGTWQSEPGQVKTAVEVALRAGYRHIDCAWMYGNEREVGEGIKASGVPRSEIFLTSKLWSTYHTRVEEGLNDSLEKLGTDYLDLYLIHWPCALNPAKGVAIPRLPDGSRDILHDHDPCVDTWGTLEKIHKSNPSKVRAIGTSNWSKPNLEKLLKTATVIPAINQIELHPYLPQTELVQFCFSKGIIPEAYSPLGSTKSHMLSDEKVTEIAKKHGVENANVFIAWHLAHGVPVLPKSVTPARIENNLKVLKLEEGDVKVLDELHKEPGKTKRFVKPDWPKEIVKFDDW